MENTASREARQSYLLLAFGIIVAAVLPWILQPRLDAPSGGRAAPTSHTVALP